MPISQTDKSLSMQFLLRCYDSGQGQVRELSVDAASIDDARCHALGQGMVVLDAAKAKVARRFELPWRRAATDFNVGWWCRELRTLLSAGMTVVEAMDTLASRESAGDRARLQKELLVSLQQGQSLSSAMQQSQCFPAVLVASVKASERSSALIEALDDYLHYHEMLVRLRKQVVSAAIYPSVVVGLGLLICAFLLLYVIPRFSQMYQELRGSVSTATKVLVGLSQTLNRHGTLLLLAVLAVMVLIAMAWQAGLVQRVVMRGIDAFTPLQRQLDHFRLAKLYQSLALMFRGGYALDDALRVCASLRLGDSLTAGLEQAQQHLMLGQAVSAAFVAAGLTDQVSERLLRTGERTGNFDRVLQTIADRHVEAFTTFVERATRLVEPMLLMLVALVVGGIVVMMYMPVFDIASSLR